MVIGSVLAVRCGHRYENLFGIPVPIIPCIGASSAQPFLCRHCINTNTNADINSWSDGLTTTTASSTGDNASREQRLAELRRLLIERRGMPACRAEGWIEHRMKKNRDRSLQFINTLISQAEG